MTKLTLIDLSGFAYNEEPVVHYYALRGRLEKTTDETKLRAKIRWNKKRRKRRS